MIAIGNHFMVILVLHNTISKLVIKLGNNLRQRNPTDPEMIHYIFYLTASILVKVEFGLLPIITLINCEISSES